MLRRSISRSLSSSSSSILNPSSTFTFSSLRFAMAARNYHLPANHPILSKIANNPSSKVAIRHVPSGNTYTYNDLLHDIGFWREKFQALSNTSDSSAGSRIAIMGENSYQFAVMFYAALTLPHTFVIPLCTNHTAAEIEYQLNDSEASFIVTPERFLDKVSQFDTDSRKVHTFESIQPTDKAGAANLKDESIVFSEKESSVGSGYMLYTSGTSGKPKGVVTPLETFTAQAHALTAAWNINADTNFLHILPLHHVHGVLIALTLSILAGGRVEFAFPFKPQTVLDRFAGNGAFDTDPGTGNKIPSPPINTFTAVPTIYTRLISFLDEPSNAALAASPDLQNGIQRLKLAMCGSAALPDPLRNSWDRVTKGAVPLLERYGMTETGITLTQPLEPSRRVAGTVGKPAPTIVARIIDLATNKLLYESGTGGVDSPAAIKPSEIVEGDLLLGGPTVFESYWRKEKATKETFLSDEQVDKLGGNKADRWFITGDIARYDPATDSISILGRSSMDIIKSGGEKLSALEIEREILSLPDVAEVSVVGIPDEEWGDAVAAIIVLKSHLSENQKKEFTLAHLKTQLKKTLAGWKIPKHLLVVDAIPRNQMGKVNKKSLVATFFP